ncbi:MAG TPA: right-handed parallel beta-helix repeat-containing protein [Gaiellaceae bacterium]|nr:right-handed parallel beta-helix repeat-containing protein [Gaiellaceae bacterium]
MSTQRPTPAIARALLLVALSVATAGAGSASGGRGSTIAAALPPLLGPSTGRALYVSPNGSDSNPGTREKPLRTIQSALDRARPGQRVLVHGGVYEESLLVTRSGTRPRPITLAAVRGERPVVRARQRDGDDSYALEITASYIRVKGLVLEGATGTSSANVYVENDASYVELRGNEIRNGQDQGIFTDPETSNVHIIGNLVHDNGAGLPGQHQSHGMYLKGSSHLVANNVVYNHPYGFGIHIYRENIGTIVVQNTVAYSGLSGIVIGGERVERITIRNNIFAYNARYGIAHDSDNPSDSVVDTNLLYANGWGGIEPGFEGTDLSGGNRSAPPRFVSARARDFHLTRRSPAVDRAQPAFSPRADRDGVIRPQGRGPDLGAFEWAQRR